ncbi:MAG: T9SS type A sorting domain-containing protein [Flavobacteriales bacterium]|nr:T9SS type A sorting domain-containing protein [Flavobacteriales bacterium]
MKKLLLLLTLLVFISLEVNAQIIPSVACDDNNDGIAQFDLNSRTPDILEVLNGLDPAIHNVTFYETLTDSQTNVNPIVNASAYMGTNQQVIYARIENTQTNAISYYEFYLIVSPQPNAGQDGTITVCDFGITVNLFGVITNEQLGGVWVRVSGAGGTFNSVLGTFTPTNGTTTSTFHYTLNGSLPCTNDSSLATVNVIPAAFCFQPGCGGFFIDSGGPSSNYSNNANQTVTICPDAADEVVTVTFTSFDVESGNDALYVYDGVDATFSQIPSSNEGTANLPSGGFWGTTNPGPFTANNASGCLTFNFRSNESITGSGWIADVSCSSFTDKIRLIAFVDLNNNGSYDAEEYSFAEGSFVYQINDDGNNLYGISYNGTYTISDQTNSNSYDFSYEIKPELTPYLSNNSTYNNIIITSGSGTQTLYFPISVINTYSDVSVTILPINAPRPGFNYTNTILLKNSGFNTLSGTVTFTKDPNVSITSVSQSGVTTNPDGFSYNYSNLLPNELRVIDVTMNVPTIPTVNIGDVLTNTVAVTSNATDINSTNDSFSISQIVIGAYDPNDKMESHGEQILHSTFTSADYLYYTIRFENTGTASAINVNIEDVLDEKLDENSLSMISASHNYNLNRNGTNLKWTFEDILLPPSIPDTNIGKGYVTFRVKPKPGYAIGDVIENTASIYFDFNPAIITNTFSTEFVAPLELSDFSYNTVFIAPNPAKTSFEIQLKNTDETLAFVTINDFVGKTIKTLQSDSETLTTIDTSDLSQGIYLIEITTKNNHKLLKKLIIE